MEPSGQVGFEAAAATFAAGGGQQAEAVSESGASRFDGRAGRFDGGESRFE
jgi:hypothetical protein